VLRTTDLPEAPRFSMLMADWNLEPTPDAKLFDFTPPRDAKQIERMPATPGRTRSISWFIWRRERDLNPRTLAG
jgi:hypothetical protein